MNIKSFLPRAQYKCFQEVNVPESLLEDVSFGGAVRRQKKFRKTLKITECGELQQGPWAVGPLPQPELLRSLIKVFGKGATTTIYKNTHT